MNRRVHLRGLMLLGTALLGFAGCGPSSKDGSGTKVEKGGHDHKHGHHKETPPATYAEAVKELDEYRVIVKDALAKNDTNTADHPLHEIAEMLDGHVVSLAEKAGLEGGKLDEVKKAVKQLFDSFDKVDLKVHDPKQGSTYEEESSKIDEAMATLRQNVPGEK